MKRIISIFLATLLLVLMIPISTSVMAEETVSPMVIDSELSGTNSTDIKIPSFLNYNAITTASNSNNFTLSGTAWLWYAAGNRYNPGSIFGTGGTNIGTEGNLYDGTGATAGTTYGYAYNQGGAFNYDGSIIYTDFIYDLGAVYDISNICVVHGDAGALMTGHYKLFASETVSTSSAFSDNELLVDFVNEDSIRTQVFKPSGEKIYARYVCLRILNPVADSYAKDPSTVPETWLSSQPWYLQLRLAQFAVYGTKRDADEEEDEEVSPLQINKALSGTNSTDIKIPDFKTYNAITTAETEGKFTLSGTCYIWSEAQNKYNTGDIMTASMLPDGKGRFYDGVANSGGKTMGYSYNQGGEFCYDGTKIYTDIVYDLGAVYDISNICVVHGNNSSLMTGHYMLYGSETKASDFTENELLVDFVNKDRILSQVFSPSSEEPMYARYVALRIVNPVANSYAEDPSTAPDSWNTQTYYTQIRLDQFVVYGSKLPGQATITTDTLSHFAYYSGKVDLTHNLVANKQPESIKYINVDKGVTTPADARVSGDKLTSTVGAYDGHTQGGYNQISFARGDTSSGKFVVTDLYDDESRRYVQFDYKLDGSAKISDVVVFGHMAQSLSPSHFKVSFADSADALFGNDSYTVNVNNSDGKQIVKVALPLDETVICKYVGIRVICGVSTSAIGGSMNEYDYYARISHIDVHGVWQDESRADDNLTVEAEKDFIKVSKSEQKGCLDNNSVGALGTTVITASAPKTAYNDGVWYEFIGWYKGGALISEEIDYDYLLTSSAATITAKYSEATGYKLEFKDASGNALYTAFAKANTPISDDDIFAASRKVPELYGFVRKLDENSLQYWSEDVTVALNADMVVTPVYKKSEDRYTVKIVKGEDSKEEQLAFDQKLVVSDPDAKAWKTGDSIIAFGNSATLYVSGDMELKAVFEDVEPQNSVVIMDVIKSQYTLSVMAHINNAENKEISEAGIIFVSGATADALAGEDWNETNLYGRKFVEVVLDDINGSDFMGSLIGINLEKETVRVAQAYVKFSDGTSVYSEATEKQVFKSANQNPLLIYGIDGGTADPWVIYHDGYYYHCHNENNSSTGKYTVVIAKCESLFTLNDPIMEVTVWDNDWADDTFYSNYAPELHNIDGVWYIYTAPTSSIENEWGHDMIVYKFEGESPLADGENTKYEKLGYMEGFPELGNNIDGTVWHYNDMEYFIWSYSGKLYIGELVSPTEIQNVTALPAPQYDWENWIYSLNEGPAVLEHNGKYFVSFAASDSQSDYYSLGLMEFAGGDPLDINNWTKWEEPVLSQNRELGIYGPGHASFTKVLVNGNWVDYVVYHASHDSVLAGETTTMWNSRDVYAQPVYWDVNGKPVFGEVSNSIY